MNFTEAVTTCLTDKYCDFTGRAPRSEYWWFALFQLLAWTGVAIVGGMIGPVVMLGLLALLWLGLFLPNLGLNVRRLHDTNHSGWWLLILFVPVVGGLVFFIFSVIPGTPGPNRFGPDPLGRAGQGMLAGGPQEQGALAEGRSPAGGVPERFRLEKDSDRQRPPDER